MKIAIKRILVMVLMVMMVITLVPNVGGPTKAYADVMDPLPWVTVGYIDENGYGSSVYLSSDTPYYVNGAHEATADGTVDWNAYYNAETGLLTYNNYYGTGVDIRTDRGYLNVELIGDNYIGGKGQFGIYVQDELGISSEYGGTLTIEAGMQDATSYGIYSRYDSVFLSGNADISIRMNSNGAVYGIKSGEYAVVISDQVSVDMECKSSESSAYGFDASGLYVASPYKIYYKGEGSGTNAWLFSGLNNILLGNDAKITADIKGGDENCVYYPISELRNKLNECDYRAVVTKEDNDWYHAKIEPKTSVGSPIRINYSTYTLPDIHLYMTGEEAYEKYLDALECPTNENYDGSYGWYVNLDSAFSGISDDTGEGANLNTSSERFEFGEPYYIMFAISIDEENFVKNEDQKFEVNGSEDIIWSEGLDPDTGKFQYIVAIQQIAGYGPATYVYAGAYNTVKYSHNDTVSFDDVNYSEYTSETIEQGKEMTLYAKAAEDDEFLCWRKGDRINGEIISTDPVVTVTIDGSADYYAVFQPKIPASGKYNNSVDYTFDETTGTLTLIPTGDDGEGGKTGILDFKGWGQSPFYKNNKIKHVIIQEGITDIREAVFEENELETVSLPASLNGINWRAFEDCVFEGGGFTVDAASENFKAVDGSLFSKDGTIMHKFVKKPGQTEYTIPEGVTWIIGECFDKTELDKVTLRGEGLNVDDYAFDYCTLGEVIIEEGVSEVDYQRSTLLADSITFPSTITWINAGGFIDSENLKNIYVSDDNPYFGSIDGVLFNYEYASGTPESGRTEFILHMYPWGKTTTSYTVPDGVTTINGMSMQTPNLKEIVIPESVNAIKYYAFAYRHGSPITVQINNPECQLDSDIFQSCDDVTIKAAVGSTAQVLAEEKGFTFIPIGESHGKLAAPKNVRWDGTTARWDAVEGVSDVRYSIKFYEVNSDGTLYHVASLDQTITDGSTEYSDFRQRMLYKNEQYCFTVTASAIGYETSDTVQSPYGNGVFERKTALPTVERDTLVFPTDASRDIEGVNYFEGSFSVWNSSNEKVINSDYFSNNDPELNLRQRFYWEDLPYGTYKIQADLSAQFYGWTAWLIDAPEDQYVYYDYQPISDIDKIEVTIPDMIVGMKSDNPSGLVLKAFAGDKEMDGIYPSTSAYWNDWEYRTGGDGVYTYFSDGKIEKGMYQYAYRLEIDKYRGYNFAENVEVYVNGSKENVTITSKNDYEVDIRYEYPVGTQPKVGTWKKEGGQWHVYDGAGNLVTNSWAEDSTGWCWLDASGNITKSKWIKDEGEWYYLNANGYRTQNDWAKDGAGWCYMGPDGKMVKNVWKKDSKGWCYLGSDGYMVTNGWAPDSKGTCWIGQNGYMVEQTKWIQIGSDWYHITNGYRDESKWMKDSQGWCWLQEDGKMLTNGWAKDSIGTCWIAANGYMPTTTQWIQYEGSWYHITNGYRDENKWMKDSQGWCWLQADGKMLTNGWAKDSIGWCWIAANGYMPTTTQWIKYDGGWYYIEKGYRVQNAWRKDSKGWCYLGSDGRMVTEDFVKDSKGYCWIGPDGYMEEVDKWIGEPKAVGSSYIIAGYRVDDKAITIDGVEYTFDKDGKLVG